ncbi:hypothetical protein Y032_0023g786 [Ancylostoma ceylanicum]|uniref:Uncharacterized protein n=1 Tax=Ancylostoma ceylanicum TaxID=53326 RepID=A0A016UWX7_9BILA|nr:hypothetical protein Y032_0023g786 [Ancylostoma ceylanicum]
MWEGTWRPWPFVVRCELPHGVSNADPESVAHISCGASYKGIKALLVCCRYSCTCRITNGFGHQVSLPREFSQKYLTRA